MTVADRLRAGEPVTDDDFDAAFSGQVRAVSFRHWTPVTVARRAAQLLVKAGATHILDVGAGPGKFCIVGALTTGACFTGIEQRSTLVEEARAVAARLAVDNVRFVHANLLRFDCTPFDAFYLYNPFTEQIDDEYLFPIDTAIERSQTLYDAYVAAATAALVRAPAGTLVATFHGLGGPMPPQYRRVHDEMIYGGGLALWLRIGEAKMRPRKTSEGQAEACPPP